MDQTIANPGALRKQLLAAFPAEARARVQRHLTATQVTDRRGLEARIDDELLVN